MLCEKCKQNQAIVQWKMRVNEHQESHYLCHSCYKDERNKLGAMSNIGNSFFGFGPSMANSFFNQSNEQPFMSEQSADMRPPSSVQTNQTTQKGLSLIHI